MSTKTTQPFSSLTKAVPPIRGTLDVFPVEVENRQLMYFFDNLGYATENFAVDKSIAGLLPLIDGKSSVKKIIARIQELGGSISEEDLLPFITMLDENRILFSDYFKAYKKQAEDDFELSDTRTATCSGTCYPDSADSLRATFDAAFAQVPENGLDLNGKVKALYAPHIDPRVAMETYVKAFRPLKHCAPKRVIMLGTSHYAGSYFDVYDNTPFIVSRKNFQTPLGTVANDSDTVAELESLSADAGITTKDRAHRVEHSLELHLIFLQYLWDHEFTITPILVNSFDELMYKEDGALGKKIDHMADWLSQQQDDDTLILISGDLSHFGHKFGDTEKASDMFNEVKLFDGRFLENARNKDANGLLKTISEVYDRYRICGFPPLYTWLRSQPQAKGDILAYYLWDERERESAVSVGSVLYCENGAG